ncbi:MAG: response regulator [Phormidesmis sp.]
MPTDPTVSTQTYQYFVQEATELLQTMEDELKTLRQDFSLQKVHTLMRTAHTLKGASASVGLETIQKTTHSLEDIFKALCYDDTVVSLEMEQLIFQGYECLQLLMSAQLVGAKVDGDDILNRMAAVVSQLQKMLGARFGQEGHLPTSAELGFDMTQSIFQVGVAQRLETLEQALKDPRPRDLRELLKTQAEVFMGLGESLNLPGFEAIAQMTHQALERYPDLVLHIAPVALENFKAAQAEVLGGDRTQGGIPSVALLQFCGHARIEPVSKVSKRATPATNVNSPSSSQKTAKAKEGWFKRRWKNLTQPIGSPEQSHAIANSKSTDSTSKDSTSKDSTSKEQSDTHAENALSSEISRDQTLVAQQQEQNTKEDQSAITSAVIAPTSENIQRPVVSELAELTPAELNALNIQPQRPASRQPAKDAEISLDRATETVTSKVLEKLPSTPPCTPQQQTISQASSATIRMRLDHLDSLNQAMGELLTQQNKQTLYNEQLTALVKKLLNRISTQQQQLNQQQTEQLIRRPKDSLRISPNGAMPSSRGEERDTYKRGEQGYGEPEYSQPEYSEQGSATYAHFDSIELEQYSEIQLLLQSCLEETVQQSESAEAIELFVKRSEQALEKQKRLLANTRETLLEARMVPLETVFQQFPSTVERLKTQHQKPVEIELEGGEILIDRTIADSLYEPLVHLVRNAFDHGIEAPDERLAQSKPFAGTITVKGVQQGRHLLISVADDGQGLDLDSILEQAITNRLITVAQASSLTAEQTVDLLFEPGFSTVTTTNELSGRGMGLDAVRARVRSLQGWVTVSHEPGAGTCFTLQIPTSLSIAKLLLCQAEGRVYALIADAVKHILIPTDKQVRTWKGGKMITWQTKESEHLVPVNALKEVLNYASPMSEHPSRSPRQAAGGKSRKDRTANPVILLHHQDTLVGLEVEQLLGEQELVISPLGNTIVPPAYLYGSSILPDGQLTLVLDGLMLAKIIVSQRKHYLEARAAEKPANSTGPVPNKPVFLKPLVLTVDDSITVCNTLTEALQKSNYQVIQARDGAEALQLLERYPDVQVILCDIEMPGMNGFEFLKARQRLPEVAAIPTIMLTSRMGTKHRLLTEELGATSYLTKPYLTPKLLRAITEAIEGKAEIQITDTTKEQTYAPLNTSGSAHG